MSTERTEAKPITLLTWAALGAVIGSIGFLIVAMIVLSFGGLAYGVVTRDMWKAAARMGGVPMLVSCVIIGAVTIGCAFDKQYRQAFEFFVCLAACFIVQIALVDLVAYEIAPRFPSYEQIKVEAK